jgi:hypothetical protein
MANPIYQRFSLLVLYADITTRGLINDLTSIAVRAKALEFSEGDDLAGLLFPCYETDDDLAPVARMWAQMLSLGITNGMDTVYAQATEIHNVSTSPYSYFRLNVKSTALTTALLGKPKLEAFLEVRLGTWSHTAVPTYQQKDVLLREPCSIYISPLIYTPP